MTTEKKPRGRPATVASDPVPKNPDQKLATRGYVKCLAGKVQNHHHLNVMGEGMGWCAISVICGFFVMALASAVIGTEHMPTTHIVLIAVGWSIVVNGVVLFGVLWAIDSDRSGKPENTPDEIAAYVPPKERSKYDRDTHCGDD